MGKSFYGDPKDILADVWDSTNHLLNTIAGGAGKAHFQGNFKDILADVWDEDNHFLRTSGGATAFDQLKIGALGFQSPVTLTMDTFVNVSMDVSDPSVGIKWPNGLTINNTKDGLIVTVKGRYTIRLSGNLQQHATAWRYYELGDDQTAQVTGQNFIPTQSSVDFSPDQPTFFQSGMAELDVGAVIHFQAKAHGFTGQSDELDWAVQYEGPTVSI